MIDLRRNFITVLVAGSLAAGLLNCRDSETKNQTEPADSEVEKTSAEKPPEPAPRYRRIPPRRDRLPDRSFCSR